MAMAQEINWFFRGPLWLVPAVSFMSHGLGTLRCQFGVVVMPLRPLLLRLLLFFLGRGTIPAFFHLFKGAQVTMVTGISFRGGFQCVDHW